MILAVDIGNSNIVLGGYVQGEIKFLARVATSRHLEADEYAIQLYGILKLHGWHKRRIEGVVISSVVPGVTPKLVQAAGHFTNAAPMILSLKHAGKICVDIENPAELGMDILASAIAVCHNMPLPAVIIDMGTATKLTAVDAECKLRGVSISPGLFVSMEALVGNASLLSGIALEAPPAAIGRNSAQSMQSGLVLGTASMLDGMVDRFEQEMGPIVTLVATGGGAPIIMPHCRRPIQFCDTLLLDGLYQAYINSKNCI